MGSLMIESMGMSQAAAVEGNHLKLGGELAQW